MCPICSGEPLKLNTLSTQTTRPGATPFGPLAAHTDAGEEEAQALAAAVCALVFAYQCVYSTVEPRS